MFKLPVHNRNIHSDTANWFEWKMQSFTSAMVVRTCVQSAFIFYLSAAISIMSVFHFRRAPRNIIPRQIMCTERAVHIFPLRFHRKSNRIESHVISLQSLSINTKPKNSIWCCGRSSFQHPRLFKFATHTVRPRAQCVCVFCVRRLLSAERRLGNNRDEKVTYQIRKSMHRTFIVDASILRTYELRAFVVWKFDMPIRTECEYAEWKIKCLPQNGFCRCG